MKLGVDIMGGDFAPDAVLDGVVSVSGELPADTRLVLFGDATLISDALNKRHFDVNRFDIVHAPDVIGMGDKPTRALSQKPDSTIATAFAQLADGKIDAFASAGNTGAMLVGSVMTLGPIKGVLRPCITTVLPKADGGMGILLDVGTNPDCKPEILKQFAIIGSIYAENVLGIQNPKIGLLNIGEEEEKGNMLTIATYKMLAETQGINFVGNVEGHHLFGSKADVVVCDGFTGNVVLKTCEAMYVLTRKRGFKDDYFERFNYENYGGTPVLGINKTVIIGHGISNAKAIHNMIKLTWNVYNAGITTKIENALSEFIDS